MCPKWSVKFSVRDFLLEDAPWSGGPVAVGSFLTETVIENNRHYTMWETADTLKIPTSIVTGENE